MIELHLPSLNSMLHTIFDVARLVIRDASFFGFSCSYSCSVEDGARARIRSFEYDYDHHFIEHEQDFLMQSSNSATSKLAPAVQEMIAVF